MKRFPFRSLVAVFWLVTMGWLVRYEAYPALFTKTLDGYRQMFDGGQLFLDSWMKILLKERPIGFSHTQVEMDEGNAAERYHVHNRTAFEFAMLGERQYVQMRTEAWLDDRYALQRFEMSLNSRRYDMAVEGERADGEDYAVRISSPAGTQRATVRIPDDAVIYSPLTDMAMSRLNPGDFLRIKTLDPMSLTAADVLVRALRRERITVGGREEDATVLAMEYQGMDLTTWIASDGRVLRQETPYAWTMEACTAREALSIGQGAVEAEDLLVAMAVPIAGTITDPVACRELRLRVNGLRLDPSVLDNARQRVAAVESNAVEFVMTRLDGPSSVEEPVDTARYLASSPFIQSDDPRMRRKAESIMGGKADDRAKAAALYEWVFENVRKNAAVTLPSALDVLDRMEGDCNEHTYLTVALARAAGLAAQVRVGIVYKDGRFFYHAWPAVYAGGWWEMDPTWGQETAGVTHIALLEGEIGDQLPLLGTLGKIEVEVLSQEY